ncbi:hypothetical protein JQX09_02750 [Sulfitobacter pseudonitzschiae]|uniref:Uncharacterized protein n=1 Tax=Pseudosulfitobacter pseudonitzschiae TaxID=1402135 RepID=A0A9Q2NHS2_9RHOB|nr:hypothetical protein [Pseudosulfitobacter pseudonitzschiae]MBM2290816.1 hypothetical protein [Pseudosulfitobacter pseudonitzschiae]MBM2295734.1 hypothetical protein [Pseudosulfitobacter pseudonitzschiae]MBM2300646.1 hypothetical protein [Pseudosulfitobacter pseudonitzschiae]MBM2310431.1 hypothetical protein [Pseudosulfitobacter pseudonitzschiae]MBM2315343.1 hypothetical protein [Pseudosulfitobacter pseudonitzschiae]
MTNAMEDVTHTPCDPIPAWFAEWKQWRKVELDLSETPEGGDFDMPEQLAAAECHAALARRIAKAQPTTAAGVQAQLEWLDADSIGLGCIDDMNVHALRNAIAAIKSGLTR